MKRNRPELIRMEVLAFANEMESVLLRNDHKSGWSEMTPREVLSRIVDEVRELSDLINGDSRIEVEKIISEAVDISNFCMFLVDNLRESENFFYIPNNLENYIADRRI